MKGSEAAESLRKLAAVLERFDRIPIPKRDVFDEDCQVGAAAMLAFIRDLFTIAGKDVFTREDILVLLNEIQHDREIFTMDLVTLMETEEE
jgi:hypothetical protein